MLNHWYPAGFPARLEQLRGLGVPYRDIAAVLSFEYGRVLTRNAISGLVHRMKLPRLQPGPQRIGRVRKRPPRPRRKPPPEQPPPEIIVHNIVSTAPVKPTRATGTYSLFDLLPSSCRYPIGDGPPFMFCGVETAWTNAYCEEHARLCFMQRARTPTAKNTRGFVLY
jgi:hypothetical protein